MGTKELNRRLNRTALDGEAEAKAEAERFEVMDQFFAEIEKRHGPPQPLTEAEQEELGRFFDSLDAVVEARKLGKPVPPPYQPSKVLTG